MVFSSEDLILLQEKAKILLIWVGILWSIHAINWGLFSGGLNNAFGLRPRTIWGLVGILTSPFLHGPGDGQNDHLPGNTLALVPLGGMVLLQGIGIFYAVSIVAGLVAGLGTWLFSQAHSVVGASGVIFGYIGFLLIYGLVGGNLIALLLAVLVGIKYGALVTGSETTASLILPLPPGSRTAWDTHLFGFIGGIVAAYLLGYLRMTTAGA